MAAQYKPWWLMTEQQLVEHHANALLKKEDEKRISYWTNLIQAYEKEAEARFIDLTKTKNDVL